MGMVIADLAVPALQPEMMEAFAFLHLAHQLLATPVIGFK